MSVHTNKLVVESGYYNPYPLVWLLGHANEDMVVVEGMETMALGPKYLPLLRDSIQIWG